MSEKIETDKLKNEERIGCKKVEERGGRKSDY